MTIPTLLMLLESHSLSNRTPVKIPRKVLRKLTTIVVTSVVIRLNEAVVLNDAFVEDRRIAEDQAAKDRYWKIPICYDDDEDDTIAVTPDEVIKSSVENLVLIPSESEGIPDVPLCNNSTALEAFKEHSEIVVDFNDDSTSSDDDSPYGKDIDYVDASPPDSELVSLEVVENVTPEDEEIEDDILRE
ncbi:hypothetical protein Tco_1005058 [Tanacetum coccineum]|uniref:Uncharacterized protein n=1 Tax=Tanacetum coccineum TaxID=301880 RepID=A0ABQ5FDU5_9ASTR